jgi:hypothetical protein
MPAATSMSKLQCSEDTTPLLLPLQLLYIACNQVYIRGLYLPVLINPAQPPINDVLLPLTAVTTTIAHCSVNSAQYNCHQTATAAAAAHSAHY